MNWNRSTVTGCVHLQLCVFQLQEEPEQIHLLQAVLHLPPSVFQLQQGVGAEGGTGTEAPAPPADSGQRAPGKVALRPANRGAVS